MYTQSQQTGTLEVSRSPRSLRFGRTAGWLIIGLVVISLIAGLIWSNNLATYPGAERQAVQEFPLRFQPAGILSQQSAYQTSDDMPKVLGWYAQHFGLGHEMPQGDNCVRMTQMGTRLFLQHSLTVTLCAQQTRTLILINRSIAVH